jgi:hypothetical protein
MGRLSRKTKRAQKQEIKANSFQEHKTFLISCKLRRQFLFSKKMDFLRFKFDRAAIRL